MSVNQYQFVKTNIIVLSVVFFLIVFGITQYAKPKMFYNSNGSIRQFGIGYKNKTIFPIWLFAVVLGILSYVGILYYLEFVCNS